MELSITRTTFRRLVMLQLLMFLPAIGVAIYQVTDPRWTAFDTAFRRLTAETFGDAAEISSALLLVAGLMILANIVAMLGMLKFKVWARATFTFTTVIGYPLYILGGGTVEYSDRFTGLADGVGLAATGATLLIAYANGLGSDWFAGMGSSQN